MRERSIQHRVNDGRLGTNHARDVGVSGHPGFVADFYDQDPTTPLTRAHAHNDYEHERPLFDALAEGYMSIEADVCLVGNELYVAHEIPHQPDPQRTFEALYLRPLAKRIRASDDGYVYPGFAQPLQLLVDIKTDASDTWDVLSEQIAKFGHLFEGRVDFVLSGNRPIQEVLREEPRAVSLDGRISDLGQGISPANMPVVSQKYARIVNPYYMPWWPPRAQRVKRMRDFAEKCHAEDKKARLWHAPMDEDVWDDMIECGIDYIGCDDLERLAAYLRNRR